jgi:peptidyl-prolyl cis-trans isomerase D
MLDALRSATGSWVAKLLLILLVLSFAVWGISGQIMTGTGGNTVLTAGDTKVSTVDFRLAYDRQVMLYQQQFGQRVTREQASALGVDDQVLAQLLAGAVLDEQANRLRLGMSRDRLAELTAEDPAFRGPDGQFNRQQFDYVLRQVGMRPEDYLRNREQVAMRQQIVEAVSDGLAAPETFLRAVALYQGEDRTVEYIVLPQSLVEPIEDPTDDALAAWFEERKQSYAAPEYRKIAYVRLEPADIADPAAITEDQVREDYERHRSEYTTAERRRIEQLVFATEEAARTALDAIRGGKPFEEVATEQGKTASDLLLGTFPRDRVPDQAIAEAAFGLEPNAVSDVVRGNFGHVLVRVTEVTPEVIRPLADVEADIRQELALAEANRILLDVHDSYEDARAGGDSLAEAAAKQRLQVRTIEAIDRSGRGPDGTQVDGLPEAARLLAEAFETEPGVENPSVPTGANGFVFFEVEGVTPARDRTLDEVRERVVADWKAAEAVTRLSARAEELRKRIDDGASMDDVAAELALEKQTKRGLKRGSDDADFGTGGVDAAFEVAQGATGSFPAPSGDAQLIFKVTEVLEPLGAGPESLAEDQRRQLSAGIADDLLDQLVARLQGEYGVTVNRAAIQQALNF